MRTKKSFILIFIIFFFTGVYAQSIENLSRHSKEKSPVQKNLPKKVQYIEKWSKIEGILRYRLEIKDEHDKLIFVKETTKTQIQVELMPGKYKKRLGLINQFNQLFLWTDWKHFQVLEIPIPEVVYAEKKTIQPNKKQDKILLSVSGLIPKTKVYLKDPKTKQMIPIKYRQIDTNRIELMIEPKKLKRKQYDVLIRNSPKKQVIIKNIVKIELTPKEKQIQRRKKLGWRLLIPGIPQLERKEYKKARYFIWGFAGVSALATYSYYQAKRFESKYDSLPINRLYSNYITARTTSLLYRNTTAILFLIQETSRAQKVVGSYNDYKNLFYFSLSLGAIMYAQHIYDVIKYDFYFDPSQKQISALIRFSFD